jgi:hypothetical protein
MLQRKTKAGILIITQPAHSWLSGELARAWGNDVFGAVEPAEAVVLAAGLHDVGFLAWEQLPTLNPQTGQPYTFMELPTAAHLQIWTRGIEQVLLLNRYAALLTSLHYTGLTERHPVTDSPEEERVQAAFLAAQGQFQATLLGQLRKDRYYGPYTAEGVIQRNRGLMATWDWMSLLLGFDSGESVRIEDVPGHHRNFTLELAWLRTPSRVRISPWPFQPPLLQLHVEARLMEGRFQDETEMRLQMQATPIKTLPIVLTPE